MNLLTASLDVTMTNLTVSFESSSQTRKIDFVCIISHSTFSRFELTDPLSIADYMKLVDSIDPAVGIMARVRRALQFGLIIGGKTFYPVNSSASQQK